MTIYVFFQKAEYEKVIDEVLKAYAAKTKDNKQRRRIKQFDCIKKINNID